MGNAEICGSQPIDDVVLEAQLRFVIDYYVPRLRPLADRWRGAQQREMISAVDAQRVAPAKASYPTEAEAIRVAKTLYPDGSRSELEAFMARYRSQPTSAASHLAYDRKIYLFSSFKSLPVADDLFAIIQSGGIEFLAAILTLVESRGWITAAVRNELLARASALDGPAMRSAR